MTDKTTSSSASGGIGVLGLLGVAFVVLKLLHVINWSWWWVTLPFWGGFALFGVITVVALIIWLTMAVLSSPEERARAKAAKSMRRYSDALRR